MLTLFSDPALRLSLLQVDKVALCILARLISRWLQSSFSCRRFYCSELMTIEILSAKPSTPPCNCNINTRRLRPTDKGKFSNFASNASATQETLVGPTSMELVCHEADKCYIGTLFQTKEHQNLT
jgi:hypothetical protein